MQSKTNIELISSIILIVEEILLIKEILPNQDLFIIGLDSMKAINLVVRLEEQFVIIFDDDELLIQNFSTIEKINYLVQKKLGK
jgi:acyl carrier protein